MAIPQWSNGGLAGQLGLEEPMLIAIINASTEAGNKMGVLRSQVDGAAASIGAAMQSTAGAVLRSRLQLWHEDYSKILTAFVGPNSLTERTTNMLLALRQANADAAASAGSGQS